MLGVSWQVALSWKQWKQGPRIERTICGLRISDNLSPKETTRQDALEMGPDGAGLSYLGSSVVADLKGQDNSGG